MFQLYCTFLAERHGCNICVVYPDMLNAWVYALVVKDWKDVALVQDQRLLSGVDCLDQSGGRVAQGWNCLFNDMPHLCTFGTESVSQ